LQIAVALTYTFSNTSIRTHTHTHTHTVENKSSQDTFTAATFTADIIYHRSRQRHPFRWRKLAHITWCLKMP